MTESAPGPGARGDVRDSAWLRWGGHPASCHPSELEGGQLGLCRLVAALRARALLSWECHGDSGACPPAVPTPHESPGRLLRGTGTSLPRRPRTPGPSPAALGGWADKGPETALEIRAVSVTEAESDPSPPQGSFLDRLSFVS